jgi:hypothetical protein
VLYYQFLWVTNNKLLDSDALSLTTWQRDTLVLDLDSNPGARWWWRYTECALDQGEQGQGWR